MFYHLTSMLTLLIWRHTKRTHPSTNKQHHHQTKWSDHFHHTCDSSSRIEEAVAWCHLSSHCPSSLALLSRSQPQRRCRYKRFAHAKSAPRENVMVREQKLCGCSADCFAPGKIITYPALRIGVLLYVYTRNSGTLWGKTETIYIYMGSAQILT